MFDEWVLFSLLTNFAKTPVDGILSIIIQFWENTLAIGCMWCTVLAVYRVKLITWSQRANNFEISRKCIKSRLNWGINFLFGYNISCKTEFYKSLTMKNC